MSMLHVKGQTKSWEDYECDAQNRDNDIIVIGTNQILQ
jgi:hypothetical protein